MAKGKYIGAYRDGKGRVRPITARRGASGKTGLPLRSKTNSVKTQTEPDPINEVITIDGVSKTRQEWLNDEHQNKNMIEKYRDAIKKHEPNRDRHSHTSGSVIVDKDTVLKPVTGIKEYTNWDGKEKSFEFKTHEYEAIKALEDLPNIPKDTELVTVNGYNYIKRDNYRVVEDFSLIPRDSLVELEKTMREANKRQWEYGDSPQIGWDKKNHNFVWFDWSTGLDRSNEKGIYAHPDDTNAILSMWEKAGYKDQAKDREKLASYRFSYNAGEDIFGILPKRFEDPYMKYGYISYNRPPSLSWMDLPKDSVAIPTKPFSGEAGSDWRANGIILTTEPISEEKLKTYELIPEKYLFTERF